jgi:hypothetical protein
MPGISMRSIFSTVTRSTLWATYSKPESALSASRMSSSELSSISSASLEAVFSGFFTW